MGTPETVRLTVDGRPVEARAGETLLSALRAAGYEIPTLCHLEGLPPFGACRLCVVELAGSGRLVTACTQKVADGMEIQTSSPAVREARRQVLELLLADHPQACLSCARSDDCELRVLAARWGARVGAYVGARRKAQDQEPDVSSGVIVRDPGKCILCGRCVRVCQEVQGIGAIDFVGRGFDVTVGSGFGVPLAESGCVYCGQCVLRCPVGALYEQDHVERVWQALHDPSTRVVAQIAPAVRVSVGEAFGAAPGAPLTGQIVAALRWLGFDYVFDTNFGADLTVMEEAAELLRRLSGKSSHEPLPLMTSCCPAWVKYVEHYFPERLAHLSTCRSPHEMVGAVVKQYFAAKAGIHPDRLFVVSIMPCTAKKFEARREELGGAVDAVLTTREFIRMLRQAGIDVTRLAPEPMDPVLGQSTGAAVIFGGSGGVAQAALRTAYHMATGQDLPPDALEWTEIGAGGGIRRLDVALGDRVLRCAIVDGLRAARTLLESPEFERLDFVEVMACPGGCVGGGGQPRAAAGEAGIVGTRLARASALAGIDRASPQRCAHQNPEVQALYAEWLGSPGSERSHTVLHTHYRPRAVPVATTD